MHPSRALPPSPLTNVPESPILANLKSAESWRAKRPSKWSPFGVSGRENRFNYGVVSKAYNFNVV